LRKLAAAVAEKQRLIDKELTAAAEIKQSVGQRNASENKIVQQEKRLLLVESAKQKAELQLTEATAEKQALIKKLAAAETKKQDTASSSRLLHQTNKRSLASSLPLSQLRGKCAQNSPRLTPGRRYKRSWRRLKQTIKSCIAKLAAMKRKKGFNDKTGGCRGRKTGAHG
jgi:hypothetical protein